MPKLKPLVLICAVAACTGARQPQAAKAPLVSRQQAPQAAAGVSVSPAAATVTAPVEVLLGEPLALPDAVAPLSLDYLFFEQKPARVWVPAGGSGSVDVFDVAAHSFTRISGFKTAERAARGRLRVLGPSSGSIGEGFAYVGNRATSELCAIDVQTLRTASCAQLSQAPDGVVFVVPTGEVWVTAPSARAIIVLQPSKAGVLRETAVIELKGEPEGYAVDAKRGLFLTNLEDLGSTLAIDLKSHDIEAEWHADCASDGPRGIAVDSARGLVMVACTGHVQVLGSAGALLGKLDTGAGLDNLDYVDSSQLLYAAAGKAARLTVAHLTDDGQLFVTATGETAAGARNAVADGKGNAFVADPQGARLLLMRAAKR